MRRPIVVVLAVIVLGAVAVPALADWDAGVAAYNRGDFDTAAAEIAKYVASNPTDPRYAIAYYLLGSSYLQLDRTDEGIEKLRRAVELDPVKTDYRLALGRTLLDQGQPAEADTVLAALDESALSQEDRVTAALLRAGAALDLAKPEVAVAVLEAQLPAAAKSADLHRALGMAHYRNGSAERAFEELSLAYELEPERAATGRNAVAIALDLAREETDDEARQMWHRKAYDVADRLATAEPEPAYLELAGRSAAKAGLDDEAVTWLDRASRAAPDDPQIAYDLGRSLAAVGQDRRAIEVLGGALEAKPDADLTVRIHRQIAKIDARNLELADAARHFRLAGDEHAAQQIGDLVAGYQTAIERRKELLANIAELRSMEAQLEELNDAQGVTAVRQRTDAMQGELDALEENLQTVRQALQNL